MKVGVVLAGVLAVVVSIIGVVTLLSPQRLEPGTKYTPPKTKSDFEAPPISRKGPYPKAVIDGTEVKFGRMEVDEERSHVFNVRNEGAAPLVLVNGHATCQCTVGEIESGELAPGQSTRITLKWKPKKQAEEFSQSADILTNDPEQQVITLRITGIVAPRLVTNPPDDWYITAVSDDKPSNFEGVVYSSMYDKFNISALECASPLVSAEALPLEKTLLEANKSLCGYKIRVTVQPEIPIGEFSFPLTIKTDIPDRASPDNPKKMLEQRVLITGHRRGPIRILGTAYNERDMSVSLGTFDAKVGKKVTLILFAKGTPPEGLKLIEPPEASPAELRVSLEPEEKSKETHPRYMLSFEYPANAPRITCKGKDFAKVVLHTNHPAAPVIELRVFFSAF